MPKRIAPYVRVTLWAGWYYTLIEAFGVSQVGLHGVDDVRRGRREIDTIFGGPGLHDHGPTLLAARHGEHAPHVKEFTFVVDRVHLRRVEIHAGLLIAGKRGDPRGAFTVVAPSLPGYGVSFNPGQVRFDVPAMAKCVAALMHDVLGYRMLGAQGGDCTTPPTKPGLAGLWWWCNPKADCTLHPRVMLYGGWYNLPEAEA